MNNNSQSNNAFRVTNLACECSNTGDTDFKLLKFVYSTDSFPRPYHYLTTELPSKCPNMTEAQLEIWRSALIEDTIDYLEDHEDYVVITIERKTGDIIQQYEYEYSLDRFLEHLPSLQSLDVRSIVPELEGLTVKPGDEVNRSNEQSSRGDSPHTDPEFKDLDAISDPGSDGESWMTYSDTRSELSSHEMQEGGRLYRDVRNSMLKSGPALESTSESCGEHTNWSCRIYP